MNALLPGFERSRQLSLQQSERLGKFRDLQARTLGETGCPEPGSVAHCLADVRAVLDDHVRHLQDVESSESRMQSDLEEVNAAFDRIAASAAMVGRIARSIRWISLNARIEASRSQLATGTRADGDGFAAIAEEVQSLAHEVDEASSSISRDLEMARPGLATLSRDASDLASRAGALASEARASVEHVDAATRSCANLLEDARSSAEEADRDAVHLREQIHEITRLLQFDDMTNQLLDSVVTDLGRAWNEEDRSGTDMRAAVLDEILKGTVEPRVAARDLDEGSVELF